MRFYSAQKLLRNAKKLYEKVIKSFPDINKDEIGLKYLGGSTEIAGLKVEIFGIPFTSPYVETNRIYSINLRKNFFFLKKKTKKAIIAHELGHYREQKKKTYEILIYQYFLENQLNDFKKGNLYLRKRKVEIIQDWIARRELIADNHVAQTKYGKDLLKYYKSINNDIAKPLIKNLEEKLK